MFRGGTGTATSHKEKTPPLGPELKKWGILCLVEGKKDKNCLQIFGESFHVQE